MLEKKHLVFLAGATAPFAPPAMYGPAVVVQFYPWVKYYFPLFWGMVTYDNEFRTAQKAQKYTSCGVLPSS